jgi:hypothetical protein
MKSLNFMERLELRDHFLEFLNEINIFLLLNLALILRPDVIEEGSNFLLGTGF